MNGGRKATPVQKPSQQPANDGQVHLPNEARQCLELAEQCFNAKNFTDAAEHLERALSFAPDSVELLIALGNLRLQLGDLPAVRQSLRKAASRRPDDALLHVLLAGVCLRLEMVVEFECACEVLTRVFLVSWIKKFDGIDRIVIDVNDA